MAEQLRCERAENQVRREQSEIPVEAKMDVVIEFYAIPKEGRANHGIGLSLVLRKLSFGADYKTDFFYFSKSAYDWNAVFI